MVADWIKQAKRLQVAGVESPNLDAQLLFAYVLGITREQVLLNPIIDLSEKQKCQFDELIALRESRVPIAHLLGKREFWGMEFQVTKDTLIPRPDSETVVSTLMQYQRARAANLRMLDLGTGTGCLLLAALSEYPQASGLGVDISEEALVVARKNAEALGYGKRTEFKKSDWNSEIKGVWDVVLSNPPYIPAGDISGLAPDVAKYEPRLALDGGSSGLDCYRAITCFLPEILAEDGVALLEVGAGQAAQVADMVSAQGLNIVQITQDFSGVERVVMITK